jgi:branched-chain amino acid transport system ATP-binding protein
LLQVRGLKVRYGAIEAVRDVSLDVREGELVALIGGNGAGKSTFLRAISGIHRPTAGSVMFGGVELAGAPAHKMVALGMVLVPEGRRLFGLPAGGLSGGQQQMLAISRGLMALPRLLLLDEPSLGLAPLVVRQVFDLIDELRRAGTTILLVEQMAHLALKAADRAYVLERGEVVLEGGAKEILTHPRITRGYLGRRAAG